MERDRREKRRTTHEFLIVSDSSDRARTGSAFSYMPMEVPLPTIRPVLIHARARCRGVGTRGVPIDNGQIPVTKCFQGGAGRSGGSFGEVFETRRAAIRCGTMEYMVVGRVKALSEFLINGRDVCGVGALRCQTPEFVSDVLGRQMRPFLQGSPLCHWTLIINLPGEGAAAGGRWYFCRRCDIPWLRQNRTNMG